MSDICKKGLGRKIRNRKIKLWFKRKKLSRKDIQDFLLENYPIHQIVFTLFNEFNYSEDCVAKLVGDKKLVNEVKQMMKIMEEELD